MTVALNLTIYVCITGNVICLVDLLRDFAAVDYHVEIVALLIIGWVIPKLHRRDIWTNPIQWPVKELVREKFLPSKSRLLLESNLIFVKVPTVDRLMPNRSPVHKRLGLMIRVELNSEVFCRVFVARQVASNALLVRVHIIDKFVVGVTQVAA